MRTKKYEVFINSRFKKGNLNCAEIYIPGISKKEILFSTYICHPSMANNELSGPILSIFLSKWIGSLVRIENGVIDLFCAETRFYCIFIQKF